MPKYRVTDPTTGKTVTLTGDSPPTEPELEAIFKSVNAGRQPGSESVRKPQPASPLVAKVRAKFPEYADLARRPAPPIGPVIPDPFAAYVVPDEVDPFAKYVSGRRPAALPPIGAEVPDASEYLSTDPNAGAALRPNDQSTSGLDHLLGFLKESTASLNPRAINQAVQSTFWHPVDTATPAGVESVGIDIRRRPRSWPCNLLGCRSCQARRTKRKGRAAGPWKAISGRRSRS